MTTHRSQKYPQFGLFHADFQRLTKIIRGQLQAKTYCFSSIDAKGTFRKDPTAMLAKAEENFMKMKQYAPMGEKNGEKSPLFLLPKPFAFALQVGFSAHPSQAK